MQLAAQWPGAQAHRRHLAAPLTFAATQAALVLIAWQWVSTAEIFAAYTLPMFFATPEASAS